MSIRQGTRIAFTGAGGTGKTTSAKVIAETYELPMPQSASRTVYEANNLTEELVLKMNDEEKLTLQTAIFDQKVRNDTQYSYVTDRTTLDHYAYCLAYCGAFMPDDTFRRYEEKTRVAMLSTYSHIFYLPWGYWDAPDDGVRSSVDAWQSQIDAIISGYIDRWNLPVYRVPQEYGEDHRNDYILEIISIGIG